MMEGEIKGEILGMLHCGGWVGLWVDWDGIGFEYLMVLMIEEKAVGKLSKRKIQIGMHEEICVAFPNELLNQQKRNTDEIQ